MFIHWEMNADWGIMVKNDGFEWKADFIFEWMLIEGNKKGKDTE